MLDQNTDRMWYVIGAVLIGAAIIFGASTMFPSAFASVGSAFIQVTDKVSTHFDGYNQVGPMDLDVVTQTPYNMYDDTELWYTTKYEWRSESAIEFSTDPSKASPYTAGLIISDAFFKEGETYTVSFDITKLSGQVEGLGGHLQLDSYVEVYIDGVKPGIWSKGYDIDAMGGNRWAATVDYPNDNDKHNVEITFNIKEWDEGANNLFYIQPNRPSSNGFDINKLEYSVLIENIEIYEHN